MRGFEVINDAEGLYFWRIVGPKGTVLYDSGSRRFRSRKAARFDARDLCRRLLTAACNGQLEHHGRL